jgi:hypothetical protein
LTPGVISSIIVVELMTMTKTTVTYEMKTCGRCGGSGNYSYCAMYGTRCFKCGGSKRVLSAAGAKASKAVKVFIAAHFSVPVEALVVGDRIKVESVTRTIASIATDGGSKYGIGKDAAGNTIWEDYVTLTFTKPVPSAFGPYSSHGYCKGTPVIKAVAGADWDRVVAFARTLTKGVSVVETPVAA